MQVNSKDMVLLPLFKTVRSSSYTFLRKKKTTTTTTKNYFRTGHEEQEFVVSLKAHRFMTRKKRRTVDL